MEHHVYEPVSPVTDVFEDSASKLFRFVDEDTKENHEEISAEEQDDEPQHKQKKRRYASLGVQHLSCLSLID